MAKIFLISINILIAFALKIFFGGDVRVEQKMQDIIQPGETLNVTLEIAKGDREGFAKWQQVLPAGFIASSVEMNGATFSFKNQEIKVIWMELPKSETFTIQYKIETSANVTGEHNLIGKFSFIEENERRDINSEMFILSIDPEAIADNSNADGETETNLEASSNSEVVNETLNEATETTETTEEIAAEQTAVAIPSTQKTLNTSLSNVVTTKATENDLVSINREVKHIENGNYVVTLKINKSDLASFGKIEDYLPPNYAATALENADGIFSFKNNVMKILWMTLPQDKKIEVKYALKSTSDNLDSALIHGVFSYLNADQSVQNKLAPTRFKNFLVPSQIADATTKDTPKIIENGAAANKTLSNEPISNATELANDISEEKTLAESENPNSDEKLVEQITNIPAPETAVAYKVQIAASHKEVNQSYFTQRHGITETVAIEFHKTWYKYTIGSFPVYKQARDKRNQVWAGDNKINDAFVTAYNSGERISVQEALMISKQKWFQ